MCRRSRSRSSPPAATDHPLVLERSLPLDPAVLTRVSPAVERPGIHLGVAYVDGELRVWGTAQTIPLHCFVAEVVEPGTDRRETSTRT